ncbi:MAG: 30S ribosomal protein S3ae [Promethearchaeota archaeon]
MSSKAKKKKPKVKKVSFKDKNWYSIEASKSFNFKNIGEVLGVEDTLRGRTIEALLFDFTGKYSDISLKLKFRITEVNSEARKCKSIFIGHQYTNDFIRSLIGRGSTRIQSIINLTTKDGYIFRLTMICTTIKRARSSQQILIRKIIREILREFAKSLNHEKFVAGIIYGEFQNQIQRVAKTIYPLSNAVIIKSKLVSIPEGGKDIEVPDDQFEIVEVDIKRSRKSEIKRSERINVKKLAQSKPKPPTVKEEENSLLDEEESEEE